MKENNYCEFPNNEQEIHVSKRYVKEKQLERYFQDDSLPDFQPGTRHKNSKESSSK